MKFFLGTHCPNHIAEAGGDWFLSRYRLVRRRTLPTLAGSDSTVVVDVGGFTAHDRAGDYDITDRQWVHEGLRYRETWGEHLLWLPPRDKMCEPHILKKTGLTVRRHQELTLISYLNLMQLAPELPWAPVLQGWSADDYEHHAWMYEKAGVCLREQPVVGVGSVCRRQGTKEAVAIFDRLAEFGYRLHGFGVKLTGLRRFAQHLVSADSMAWSYDARRAPPLPGCKHKNCANCLKYALLWREHARRSLKGVS